MLAAPYPALQGAISVHPGHLQQAQKRSKCGRFGPCEGVRVCVHVCVAVGLTWCFGGSSTSTCGHVQVVHTPGDEPRHPATVTGPGRWQHTAAERREWCRYSPTNIPTYSRSLPSTGRLLLDQGAMRSPGAQNKAHGYVLYFIFQHLILNRDFHLHTELKNSENGGLSIFWTGLASFAWRSRCSRAP